MYPIENFDNLARYRKKFLRATLDKVTFSRLVRLFHATGELVGFKFITDRKRPAYFNTGSMGMSQPKQLLIGFQNSYNRW